MRVKKVLVHDFDHGKRLREWVDHEVRRRMQEEAEVIDDMLWEAVMTMPYDKIDTLHVVYQQDPGKFTYSYGVACRLEFT